MDNVLLDTTYIVIDKPSSDHIKLLGINTNEANETEVRLLPRRFADKWNTTFQIACGTLLGWYRGCDIIPSTQDFDLTAPSSQITSTFMEALQSEFQVKHVFGHDNDSLELTMLYHGIRTDLFFKYYHNSTHDKIGLIAFPDLRKIVSYYPKVTSTCADDLLGVLVYVPCNVEEILEAEYGNYTEDISLGDYTYFTDSKNIETRPKMTDEEFKKVERSSWP
ncbi:unnamed protein product [Bursaphelenchus okinawaensis]|uniref:Uncharacterized protein n=1 Tax=Bursaphelenchus okinawaensis TaxID=465554 RepID=A0A811KB75_9BILA|nr:unnamed protein product [Bursaphelenchus okinawaensis]CAG9098753.1 unnamed protein product [Bursaphelenchus okinawaensis]